MMEIPMRKRNNIFNQAVPILWVSIPHHIGSVKPIFWLVADS
jgi:hypothetical protein